MARRPKKSLDDQEKDANDILERVKRERKELADAQRSTRAFAVLDAIDKMVEAGDEDAKRVMTKFLTGLTVKRERLAFGLDPLPKPDAGPAPAPAPKPVPSAEPAAKPPVSEISNRVQRAVDAWNAGPQTSEARAELASAIIAFETITCEVSKIVPVNARPEFGIGERPAERL